MGVEYDILDDASPGGAESPGGGPLLEPKEPPIGAQFNPCIPGSGPGEDIPCPERTPSGFLEKLSRIPPLMLL